MDTKKGQINVRENRWGNQEWTMQRHRQQITIDKTLHGKQ
jgi:hypothetical protein